MALKMKVTTSAVLPWSYYTSWFLHCVSVVRPRLLITPTTIAIQSNRTCLTINMRFIHIMPPDVTDYKNNLGD